MRTRVRCASTGLAAGCAVHRHRDDASARLRDRRAQGRNGGRCRRNCTATSGRPTSAIFTNPPLFDIQVRFRDGGSGETSLVSAIACAGADGTSNTDDTTGWGLNPPPTGDTLTITGNKVSPGPTETITCTIVVDP